MRLKKFHFFNPPSLPELWSNLGQSGATSQFIAGGTDLLVQMKNGLTAPEQVISLLRVAELSGLRKDGHGLRIGSLARHAELARSSLLQRGWALLAEAAHKVGSPQIRNLGTIGGNLCNASPAADTAPVLLVLQAGVNLAGPRGERRIPLDSFWTGPGGTVLQKDEILKEVWIPQTPLNTRSAYLKLGRRKSLDLALASVAVLLTVEPGTRLCREARIALGAVAPTPIRAKETERFLQGKTLDAEVILAAGTKAQEECSPISDVRASSDYRREMVRVLIERAIKKALGMAIPPTGI